WSAGRSLRHLALVTAVPARTRTRIWTTALPALETTSATDYRSNVNPERPHTESDALLARRDDSRQALGCPEKRGKLRWRRPEWPWNSWRLSTALEPTPLPWGRAAGRVGRATGAAPRLTGRPCAASPRARRPRASRRRSCRRCAGCGGRPSSERCTGDLR